QPSAHAHADDSVFQAGVVALLRILKRADLDQAGAISRTRWSGGWQITCSDTAAISNLRSAHRSSNSINSRTGDLTAHSTALYCRLLTSIPGPSVSPAAKPRRRAMR